MCEQYTHNADMKELEERRRAGRNWCHIHDLYHNQQECPLCVVKYMTSLIEPYVNLYKERYK